MQAGTLRHRVLLQTQSTSIDTFGAPLLTWYDKVTVWAHVAPSVGRELLIAQQLHAEADSIIWIRYRNDVVPTMRAVFNGKNYDIQAVIDEEERHRMLQLICKSGLSDD